MCHSFLLPTYHPALSLHAIKQQRPAASPQSASGPPKAMFFTPANFRINMIAALRSLDTKPTFV
jgi:hypothetical protein